MYADDVAFMTLWEHITTDVEIGERLVLGEVVLEVTDISAGVITVKSNRDYTFQENEKIRLARDGFDYLPYLVGNIDKAFKFLAQCGVNNIDYVAVPVEREDDITRVRNRFAFYNHDIKSIDALNEVELCNFEPFYEGLIAKIGSEAGIDNFEEILRKLNNDKDAIMIDRTNLALELTDKEKLDTATTHFIE